MSVRSTSVLHGSGERPYSRKISNTSPVIFSRSWLVALRKTGDASSVMQCIEGAFSARAISFAKSKFCRSFAVVDGITPPGSSKPQAPSFHPSVADMTLRKDATVQLPRRTGQRSSKVQSSTRRTGRPPYRSDLGLELEIWRFFGAWCLGLGAWGRQRFLRPVEN